jgi:hypothetical protein
VAGAIFPFVVGSNIGAGTFAMTHGFGTEQALVVGILLTHADQLTSDAVRSLERIGLKDRVHVDIAVREEGVTALSYALRLQSEYERHHVLLLDESVYVAQSFLEDVQNQIEDFSSKSVAWGAIGNSGLSFPYFKPICNMLIADAPTERFAGVLPAAHLDRFVLLIHRDVRLSTIAEHAGCPADAPLNDLVGLAAWEAGMPSWICNVPVYASGSYATAATAGNRDAWSIYLSSRYSNATFASSFGTLEITDHAENTKDYYYAQMRLVLDRSTRAFDTASVSVFVFATYYDLDILDRCLMGIASQFQRPVAVYIIGLVALDDPRKAEVKQVVDRYRHYLALHWGEEELPDHSAIDQFGAYLAAIPDDQYSLFAYDTFVLFPQAVQQICEFMRICLGDRNVLPITTAEVSRLYRSVESAIPSQPRVFFREIEKQGFSHKEAWLSSQPSVIIHFSFPNAFLKRLSLSDIDVSDLGSCLPQRLLAEPLSFFLIERGAGYTSFQKPSTDETVSPLREAGTPFHLANKAHALLTTRSNILQFSMVGETIVPMISYRDESSTPQEKEALRQADVRIEELQGYHGYAEQELARLHLHIQQQNVSLEKFRKTWHFKAYKYFLKVSRPLRKAVSQARKTN